MRRCLSPLGSLQPSSLLQARQPQAPSQAAISRIAIGGQNLGRGHLLQTRLHYFPGVTPYGIPALKSLTPASCTRRNIAPGGPAPARWYRGPSKPRVPGLHSAPPTQPVHGLLAWAALVPLPAGHFHASSPQGLSILHTPRGLAQPARGASTPPPASPEPLPVQPGQQPLSSALKASG